MHDFTVIPESLLAFLRCRTYIFWVYFCIKIPEKLRFFVLAELREQGIWVKLRFLESGIWLHNHEKNQCTPKSRGNYTKRRNIPRDGYFGRVFGETPPSPEVFNFLYGILWCGRKVMWEIYQEKDILTAFVVITLPRIFWLFCCHYFAVHNFILKLTCVLELLVNTSFFL